MISAPSRSLGGTVKETRAYERASADSALSGAGAPQPCARPPRNRQSSRISERPRSSLAAASPAPAAALRSSACRRSTVASIFRGAAGSPVSPADSADSVGSSSARPIAAPPTIDSPDRRTARRSAAARLLALAFEAPVDGMVDDGRQRGRQHHLAVGERPFDAPLQHEHAGRDPAAQDRDGQQGGVLLLAEARDVLEVPVLLADRDRDRTHAFGGEARDALAGAQVHAADRLGRKADVAAHREAQAAVIVVLAHVDAGDVRARDVGDVRAHRRQNLLERAVFVTQRDQPEDAVQRPIAGAMNLNAEGLRARHTMQDRASTVSGAFPTGKLFARVRPSS